MEVTVGTGVSQGCRVILEVAQEELGEQERVTRATSTMWFGAIHPGRVRRPFPVTGLELHFLLLAPSSLGFSSI